MGRVGEKGEAESKEESVKVWGFGKGGNGSGSELRLQLHFLVALSAFPLNFNLVLLVSKYTNTCCDDLSGCQDRKFISLINTFRNTKFNYILSHH